MKPETYFCPPCKRSVLLSQKCEHWSKDLALAGYWCSCGKEGLAPDWDWHCIECHRDFTKVDSTGTTVGDKDAFYAHECVPVLKRTK